MASPGRHGIENKMYQSSSNPTFHSDDKFPSRPVKPAENREKLDGLKKEVEDVRIIMVNNIEKTIKRGEDLDEMLIKSEELQHSANIFQRASRVLKKKMCCDNFKSGMTLTIVVMVLISLLILIIVLSTKPWNK